MRKAIRITLGFVLLLAGLVLALPGVPGPGIAVMIVGLVILSDHFDWARGLLDWAKRKAEDLRNRARAATRS